MVRTGYFADQETFTKVHLVGDTDKPLCGSVIKDKEFKFTAMFPVMEHLECEKCKKILLAP